MTNTICPNCGKEIDGSAAFCPNCGHALQNSGGDAGEQVQPALRPSVFQVWNELPSTRAFRKRNKTLFWVFRLLPIIFMLIYILSLFIIKDVEQNYFVPVWCALLFGAFAFFDSMFDGLCRFRASVLCTRWLKKQNTDPIDELRLLLKAPPQFSADKRKNKIAELVLECKTAVYYEKNPSRKRLETCFACFSVFFSVVAGIAFGLFLGVGVLSGILQGGSFFNHVTLPPFFIFLGVVAVWGVIGFVKIFFVDELETKWYKKAAPEIFDLIEKLFKK